MYHGHIGIKASKHYIQVGFGIKPVPFHLTWVCRMKSWIVGWGKVENKMGKKYTLNVILKINSYKICHKTIWI